jgi:hypothetical protein
MIPTPIRISPIVQRMPAFRTIDPVVLEVGVLAARRD